MPLSHPKRPSDPPKLRITLANAHACYVDEGAGPAFIAVHGLPGSHRDFRWLAPALTPFARVVRVDLPGFGATPVAAEPDPSPLGRARFVYAVAKALALPSPIILGHSMGGVVATAAADAFPNFFGALVLLASPGLRTHRMLKSFNPKRVQRLLDFPVVSSALRPLLRHGFARAGFKGCSDADVARTVVCAAATDISVHADLVRRLALPTMVAHCEDDRVIETDILDELAAACPDGPRERFESGGHNLQKTQANELAATLRAFMLSVQSVRRVG